MSDEQLSATEIAEFKRALKNRGYDPADFKVELDADLNMVRVTRLSNGTSRTYARQEKT